MRLCQRVCDPCGEHRHDDTLRLVREPNACRADERDPHPSGDRRRRWIRLPVGPATFLTLRVVYIVARPPAEGDRGTIEVVTFVIEDEQ